MDPRPTTYNACRKGREKGFKAACIPTCTSILGEDGGAVELKTKPKPNSFTACDGSKNKKRRPNNPFARCRRAYDVAFEETQKGIAERAKAALAAALDEVNTTAVEAEKVEDDGAIEEESPSTEDVELRELKEPEEERPTPYQVPPNDMIVEEAIEPEPKDSSVAEAAIKAAATTVDESNDSGPIESEAILKQQANGPTSTGPVANEELPKEESATDDDTTRNGPTGAENIHHDAPIGMDGPKETVSASLSSDNDDNDDGIDAYIDAATANNHVSVDLEASPIADL